MTRFDILIETDNASFNDGNRGAEVARILRALADELAEQGELESYKARLHDANGNNVGLAETRGF